MGRLFEYWLSIKLHVTILREWQTEAFMFLNDHCYTCVCVCVTIIAIYMCVCVWRGGVVGGLGVPTTDKLVAASPLFSIDNLFLFDYHCLWFLAFSGWMLLTWLSMGVWCQREPYWKHAQDLSTTFVFDTKHECPWFLGVAADIHRQNML